MHTYKNNRQIISLALFLLIIISIPFINSLEFVTKTTKEDLVIYSTSPWVHLSMSLMGIIMLVGAIVFLRKDKCFSSINTAFNLTCFKTWLLLVCSLFLSFTVLKDNQSVILNSSGILIKYENIDLEFDEIYSIEISRYRQHGSNSGRQKIGIKFNLFSGKDKYIRAGDVLKKALPEIKTLAKNAGVTIEEKV